jgi:large subunit ribosomal protein L10
MKRDKKDERIKELNEVFRKENTFFLLDFKKMTVAQSVELRKSLRKDSHSFRVVKNRLALKAMEPSAPEAFRNLFEQPTALAYTSHDPIGLARALKDFAAQNKVLVVKGGMLEGQMFPPDMFEDITRLTSRESLLGRFAYLMSYPLTRFVQTLQAPLAGLGRQWRQYHDQKEKQ